MAETTYKTWEETYPDDKQPVSYGGTTWADIENRASISREAQRRYMYDLIAREPYLQSGHEGVSGLRDLMAGNVDITETPGYKQAFGAGVEAVKGNAAAGGFLRGGRGVTDLFKFGQQFNKDAFNTEFTRRMGQAQAGTPFSWSPRGIGSPDAMGLKEFQGKFGDMYNNSPGGGSPPPGGGSPPYNGTLPWTPDKTSNGEDNWAGDPNNKPKAGEVASTGVTQNGDGTETVTTWDYYGNVVSTKTQPSGTGSGNKGGRPKFNDESDSQRRKREKRESDKRRNDKYGDKQGDNESDGEWSARKRRKRNAGRDD